MSLFNFIGNKRPPKPGNDINIKHVKPDDVVFSIHSNLKCINCGMYRRSYHCYPLPYNIAKKRCYKYKHVSIIYVQKGFKERYDSLMERGNISEYHCRKFACNQVSAMIKSKLNTYLRRLYFYHNNDVIILGNGGGCRGCKICNVSKGVKCKHPKKYFRPPESIGIDVYQTLINNHIEFEIIPRTLLTVVGMVFHNKDRE